METELLHMLELKFNFHANYIDGKQNWGMRQSNGNWNGMMEQVINHVNRSNERIILYY